VKRYDNDSTIYAREIHNGKQFMAIYPVVEETVGRYTGLNDKNGKEIYEGDIFKWEDNTFGYIKYKDGSFYLKIAEIYSPWLRVIKHELENELEVIGNIYDNPELLQEVEQ